MPDRRTQAVFATVSGDPHRCELHLQCENLSRWVFRHRGRQVRLQIGPDGDFESLTAVQRLVRSCPMDALTLVSTEPVNLPLQEL